MTPWSEAVDRLAADRRHGAAWLARAATEIMLAAIAGSSPDPRVARADLRALARAIAASHPTMAPLQNTAAVFATGLPATDDPSLLLMEARSSAQGLASYWNEAPLELARRHAERFTGTVLTHSSSSDVLRTLLAARPSRIVITESRPGEESRDAAAAFAEVGIAVTMIPDSAAGHYLDTVDVVLLGADAVLATGDITNKVGSFPLAAAAQHLGRPVLVLAETMKVTPNLETPDDPATPAEISIAAPAGVVVESPLFERVPRGCITAILTEDGELDLPTLAHLVTVFADQRRALAGDDQP